MISVILFASIGDAFGSRHLDLPEQEFQTPRQIFDALCAQCPELEKYRRNLQVAVNQRYAPQDSRIQTGDEVAFFPPVSGGSRP